MGWKDWVSSIRFTLFFIAIVAAVITATAALAEGRFLNPSDLGLSPSHWWGIFTAHWVNWDLDHYYVNMGGLSAFAILFTLATRNVSKQARSMVWRFDSRLPWIVLASAILTAYIIARSGSSGMGTSAIVSAAFGAGIVAIVKGARATKGTGTVVKKGDFLPLLLFALIAAIWLGFGPLSTLVVHWISFSLSVPVSIMLFPRTDM